MRTSGLHIEFGGFDSESEAKAFAKSLARELPDWPNRITTQPLPGARAQTRDAGVTIAIIALAVPLPGAIKDGLDLADRIQLKKKFERLIAWGRERNARREKNPFVILPPHSAPVPLHEAESEQLLAAIAGQVTKPPPKT